jgi:hypothetical protein
VGTSGAPASTGTGTAGGAARRDGTADTGVPARTPAEHRAEVDGRLDASLGKFDEQLRREQQRSAEERDARAASREDGAVVDEASSSTDAAGDGGRDRAGDLRSEGNGKQGGTEGGSGDPAAGEGAGTGTGGGGGAVAKPIPSGDDDDIIARRLRKAAEAETDPELKEKLWKEYRDYKENTGGRR